MIIVAVIVSLLLIGGGVSAYTNNQKQAEKMAMEKDAMAKESAMTKDEVMVKDANVMQKDDAMSKSGSYVTLADYNADPSKYADSKKIYFFHASWCPVCQDIDKEIVANTSKLPANVTFIKTDFDSSTELRQKYGVTTQYTFVQVDADGNETAQWTANSFDKALAGIKS